jgi:murein DD-endopeptidase MepM/ murein hydrolase activator NlpD
MNSVPARKRIADYARRNATLDCRVSPPGKGIAACRRRNLALLLALVFVSLHLTAEQVTAAAPTSRGRKSWSVRWQPARLVNGAPIVFRVSAPARLQSLSGRWLEHDIFFDFDAKTETWYGLAGISLETRPGSYPLALKGITTQGKAASFQKKIAVRSAKYPSIAVRVSKQYTEPSQEQLERISREKTLKQDLFHRVEAEREWSGKFRSPVNAPVSDVFGTRRTFNGKVQSMHQGLDYAVPQGTTVTAVNSGTVLLARPLFFEGNCVVLDHGQGLLTLYLHLSEIKVTEGEKVARAQEIGLSGGTGRATGPHLHVAVRWQGVYLNPATLLNLKLP